MTTDAHAQTNTERLITTVDNTNSIVAALDALADSVASGFAAVLEAIGAVEADVGAMSEHLEHVESDLGDINSNVQSVQSDVASLSGGISDINSNLQNVQSDLAGLVGTVGGSAASFASLADTVQSNQVAINSLSEKLDMISEAVGVVQEAVEADPAEAVDPITELVSGSSEAEITVADFAGGISKHPANNVYKSTNSFSCDGDVFVDMVSVAKLDPVLTVENIGSLGDESAPKSTITVDGRTLYEAYFDPDGEGAQPVTVSHRPVDMDNLFLPVGSELEIKGSTDQSVAVGGNDDDNEGIQITATEGTDELYLSLEQYVEAEKRRDAIPGAANGANVTKADLGAEVLYTITVTWSAPSSDTTCSIGSVSGTAVGLDKTGKVLVGLSIADPDAALPAAVVEKTVDCNGLTAEITGASIRVGGSATLNEFNTVTLSAGGETAEIKFDSTSTYDEEESKDMPFRFAASDLTVAGTSVNNLLVELEYATVEGNSCSLSE